jgi:hypothetical protein
MARSSLSPSSRATFLHVEGGPGLATVAEEQEEDEVVATTAVDRLHPHADDRIREVVARPRRGSGSLAAIRGAAVLRLGDTRGAGAGARLGGRQLPEGPVPTMERGGARRRPLGGGENRGTDGKFVREDLNRPPLPPRRKGRSKNKKRICRSVSIRGYFTQGFPVFPWWL